MDANIIAASEDVVLQLVRQDAHFTALDVSNTVKERGYRIRHRETAPLVRDTYESGALSSFNYERSLINVVLENGSSTQAFLYYPAGTDPEDYTQTSQRAINVHQDSNVTTITFVRPPCVVSTTTPIQNTTGVSQRVTSGDAVQHQRWADGRLAIPSALYRHLACSSNALTVKSGVACITIEAQPHLATPKNHDMLCVKSDGRVLVNGKFLTLTFGDHSVFSITGDAQHINIQKA